MRAQLVGLLASLALPLSLLPATAAAEPGPDRPAVPETATAEHQEVPLVPMPVADRPAGGTADGVAAAEGGTVLQAGASTEAVVSIVGVTWSEDDDVTGVQLRTKTDGSWSEWDSLELLTGAEAAGTEGSAVIGASQVEVRLAGEADGAALTVWGSDTQAEDRQALSRVDGTRLDSGSLRSTRTGTASADTVATAVSAAGGPIIQTRAQWGADESVRAWSPNYTDRTRAVTIHHTAGSNAYTAEQVPAILRGIYHYHAVTLDWGDVGYGILVDRYGRAWEGRAGGIDTNLRLAHALGMNYETTGISLLGDYEKAAVPTWGFEAMAAVTAWKLSAHGVSVDSSFRHTNTTMGWTRTVPAVHGHRDVNDTLCPGRYFASRMGEFRNRVRDYQSRGMVASQRFGGADRYATAAQLAQQANPRGTDTVYLTGGDAVPDSLSVGPLAARRQAAVLLTRPGSLPPETALQVRALNPRRVVVVGGSARVSDSVLAALRAPGREVTRVSGATRYETSARLAEDFPAGGVVYLASGEVLADALAGGAAAARAGAPLLLTRAGGMPEETVAQLRRLAPTEVVLLGGHAPVPPAVEEEVRALVGGVTVTRLFGADRFATSAAVAEHGWDNAKGALLANGSSSVDAVAGTQLAAYRGDPIVLTRKGCQPGSVAAALDRLDISVHLLLGGRGTLSDDAATRTC